MGRNGRLNFKPLEVSGPFKIKTPSQPPSRFDIQEMEREAELKKYRDTLGIDTTKKDSFPINILYPRPPTWGEWLWTGINTFINWLKDTICCCLNRNARNY